MRSIWKHWLSATILATLMAAPAAFAQDPGTNPPAAGGPGMGPNHERMEQHRQEMEKALGLTDAQKDQMKQVHQDEKAKLEALRNDTSLTRDQKRAQMQAIRKDMRTRMDAILTPEQKEKMKQFRQEHKGRMGGHRHGPPPDGGTGPGPGPGN